ncbi:MAG: hypothetical protein HY554_04335 [Elusimicrobia bacterium]|nr:hypothetical protein [Elusimicrobiota bacterium]
MRANSRAWCIDCRWVSIRVPLDGGSAYWCEASERRLEGKVAWQPACERFAGRSQGARRAG